jgi:uncharacterized protein (UPF0305 family)
MENKILFMVLGFIALYLLYDGLFPPQGKESYIDKTVSLIVNKTEDSKKKKAEKTKPEMKEYTQGKKDLLSTLLQKLFKTKDVEIKLK